MIETASILDLFRKPTANQIAKRDLEEARRQFLKAQSHAKYWQHMSNYYADMIKHLELDASDK